MSAFTRRSFLRSTGSAGAVAMIASFEALQMRQALASGGAAPVVSPYGPIAPVNDLVTGLPLLQLPAGFSYKSFGWTGDMLKNGQLTPGGHDGMAVVCWNTAGPLDVLLVRNHELGLGPLIDAPAKYDTAVVTVPGVGTGTAGGGNTVLSYRGGDWVDAAPALGGTIVNCAGGPTPWGSWLTCEETGLDLRPFGGLKHGYVFEVPYDPALATGRPIVGMGRFAHEAVGVDPRDFSVILTEDDRNKAGLYRFLPNQCGSFGDYEKHGGRLQMARVVGLPNADLITARYGDTYKIEWVDIADPDADRVNIALPDFTGPTSASGPFAQGWAQGGLRMSRGEGVWYSRGKFYIVDTSTGVDSQGRRGRGDGAIWEYTPRTGTLRAVFVATNPIAANNPDNITVSPRGGILAFEDGGGVADEFGFGNRMIGITTLGDSYIFAKNNIVLTAEQIAAAGKSIRAGDYRGAEFCGGCFDPRGGVLFVNIQTPGITFAIRGPWRNGPL